MNKVAFISHGHPSVSKGGAEMASWNLSEYLKTQGIECLYIARGDDKTDSKRITYKGQDVIFHTRMHDWFSLGTENTRALVTELADVLKKFAPDVVHIHHYAHIGIELLAAVKLAVPSAKIVFTLHEFMAMCMHNGQMVKTRTLDLCEEAKYSDCHECFPQRTSGDFFLRKQFILDQFSNVDQFISPSEFLAERYIQWGIPKGKLKIIENILPDIKPIPPSTINDDEKRLKFAFFGQINPYKGLDLLLEAIALLPPEYRRNVSLDIHGANLDVQTSDFKTKVTELYENVKDVVSFKGKYQSDELSNRIASCDWVVIPSIWWENSPVVIQEAVRYGRPLIGADIGGMKEKIANKCGLTFTARDASSLASTLMDASQPSVFDYWHGKLSTPISSEHEHISLLRQICDS